jgi:hypothetical protein
MPVQWTRKPGLAPFQFRARHGLWQITPTYTAGGAVDLSYVRAGVDERLSSIPLPIGTFSSRPEAMLAVEMYEVNPAPGSTADQAAAHGFAGHGSELRLV